MPAYTFANILYSSNPGREKGRKQRTHEYEYRPIMTLKKSTRLKQFKEE